MKRTNYPYDDMKLIRIHHYKMDYKEEWIKGHVDTIIDLDYLMNDVHKRVGFDTILIVEKIDDDNYKCLMYKYDVYIRNQREEKLKQIGL